MLSRSGAIINETIRLGSEHLEHLQNKRQTQPDYASYEDNWMAEWARVDPEVKHRLDGEGASRYDFHTSSRVRAFEQDSFSMGVQGLVGCTSVIVVSRRGVWMSHIWESPTFTTQDPDIWNNDVEIGVSR